MDGSSVMTGLLLALILPPRMPLWMVVIGSAFSIAIAKEAFGGLGHNIFNPALAGRAFLAVSFPVEMTRWYLPGNFSPDALTSASPLNSSYLYEGTRLELYRDMFFEKGDTISAFALDWFTYFSLFHLKESLR